MRPDARQTARLNPVLLPDGWHREPQEEFSFSSFPDFAIMRMLDTGQSNESPLGPWHRTNLDSYIQDAEDGGYAYVDLSGYPIGFNKPDPHPGVREINASHKHLGLEPLPRSGLRLHDSQAKTATTFQLFPGRIWYPVSFEDASGLTTWLERTREGYLERIVHPSGVALEFQNDRFGRRLGFDAIGTDGTRLTVMRYAYDAAGRLVAADTPMGKSWTWSYGERSVTASDGLKTRTTHHFDDQGRVVSVDTGGTYKHGRIDYHDQRDQITVTYGTGDDAFEKLWFDDEGRHVMSANPLGQLSYKTYDDDHQLTAEIDPNGNATKYRYDTYGNPSSVIDGEGRERFRAFDDAGNILVDKDAAGNAWRYGYDDDNRLIEVKDPLGHLTNILNNEVGQPVQIMRHDGLIEFREYDAQHRLVGIVDFNSAETRFAYDGFNRLIAIKDPAGHVTRLIYDDADGRPFTTPTRIVRPDGVEVERAYHPTGTAKSVTDGQGRTTQYAYGPYDILEEIVDPKGNTLKFAYDSQERLTKVTNQLGLVWSFERDEAGRVIRETDFDGRTLGYTYDPGGRVIRRDNPDGGRLEYDYDKSGLLTELRAFAPDTPDPIVTTYAYDDTGALIKAVNPSATIALESDKLGRVIAETTNGTRIESEIDCCGRRTRRSIGDQVLDMAYDGMGGLTRWQLAGHDPVAFERNDMGQETRRASPLGFEMTQGWDAVGQLEWQAGNGFGRSYAWSRGFDPVAINDTIWGEKHYRYDQNGQITQTTHGDGRVERFGYNADLNLAASGDVERFQNWQTSAAGVVRVAHGPRGEIVRLEHDACGRVIRRRVERKGFRPQTWEFEWNAQDQMIAAHCPDGRVWEYAYDPFGRRIAKECRDERHDFLWDGDVVARETRDGKTIDWFFEPGSFRPMARAEGTRLAHIVTDHLGTPKEMVSERGALIWAADHDTWGTVRRHWRPDVGASASGSAAPDLWAVEEPEQDYAPEEYTLLCPIRFQGQWEDAETGLNYSRFRYYDPSSGHFNAKDPIGFQGGTLQSAYVLTPTVQIDPNGLRSYVVYRGIKGGQPYIGCASSADPNATFNDIMRERYSDASAEGFDSDTFERLYLGDNRNAARGLEQRYFEQAGGLDATANAQNPVGPNNEMRDVYLGAADAVLSGIDIPCCYGRDRGRGSDVPC